MLYATLRWCKIYIHKWRSIGQCPIFLQHLIFSGKKHATFVTKAETWAKKVFCFLLCTQLVKAIDIRGSLSTAPRTQLSGEVSYIFVGCIFRAPTLTNWRGWNQHFYDVLGVFSKEEARIKKRKMTWPSSLVGGHNGTPGLGLCQFNSEKNGVKAFRAFTVNSYIELFRFNP